MPACIASYGSWSPRLPVLHGLPFLLSFKMLILRAMTSVTFFELPQSIAPSIARCATLTLCIRPISNRISVPLTLHNYRLFICHISLTKVLKMICILQKSLSEELPLPHTYFCRQAVLVFNFVTGNCLFNMGTS